MINWHRELGRKSIHLVWIIFPIIDFLLYPHWGRKAVLVPTGIFVALLLVDLHRLRTGWCPKWMKHLLRTRESKRLSTPVTTMFGITTTLFLFTPTIAYAAIAMMVFGDTIAGLLGQFSHHQIYGRKTYLGTLSELLINCAIGLALINQVEIALGMALAATATETLVQYYDDNMFIPIVAGIVGSLL